MSKKLKSSDKKKIFIASGMIAVLVIGASAYGIYANKQAEKEKNKVNISLNEIEIEKKRRCV